MMGTAKWWIACGLAWTILASGGAGWAEDPVGPLQSWHAAREVRLDTGMATLLGWGLVNTVAGVAGRLATDDRRMRGFWEMNAGWGLVNTALAALSLAGDHADPETHASLGASLEAAHDLSVIFWVNTGLDVAWMAIGGWLWDRGHLKGDARTVGFGQSMVLQGAFLFGFDLVMALLEQDAAGSLMPFIGPSGAGLAVRF
jgi:hypothetical protein